MYKPSSPACHPSPVYTRSADTLLCPIVVCCSIEYPGYKVGLLGQWETFRRSRPGSEAEHDQMDDSGVRPGDRNAWIPKVGPHCSACQTTRSQQAAHQGSVDYGHSMLHVAYCHGHGLESTMHTARGSLDLLTASKLSTSECTGRVGILGK